MGAGAKAPVVDAFNMNGEPPADRAAAGLSAAPTDTNGKYVSQVDIFEGRVDVTMGGQRSRRRIWRHDFLYTLSHPFGRHHMALWCRYCCRPGRYC